MKAFRIIKNIGRIDLATLEVMDDSLSVAIELSMVSDTIKEQINTAIKEANKQYDEEMQIPWENAEAVIDYMGLNITYEKGKTDYYIASEAGITNLLGDWIDINAVVIENAEGFQSVGTSQGFPIPEKYVKEIQETELGKVMDKIFNKEQLGKGKGGISLLTKGEVSRIELTKSAFLMALISHINGDVWK